jgi:hypothetical protein
VLPFSALLGSMALPSLALRRRESNGHFPKRYYCCRPSILRHFDLSASVESDIKRTALKETPKVLTMVARVKHLLGYIPGPLE